MHNLDPLIAKLGVPFKDTNILNQALVHRSSLNEYKNNFSTSNERLEFLGDAILEQWVSQILYVRFPDFNEGQMTNLRSLIVRTENLANIAQNIGIGDYIYLSRGETKHSGRQNTSILADTFEAIIGAIFLDSGQDTVNQFLDKMLTPSIDNQSTKSQYKDPKSVFQEIAQSKEGITPNYKIIEETGPDHDKKFVAGVYLNEKFISQGEGNSKQKAEENAAINATNIIKNLL